MPIPLIIPAIAVAGGMLAPVLAGAMAGSWPNGLGDWSEKVLLPQQKEHPPIQRRQFQEPEQTRSPRDPPPQRVSNKSRFETRTAPMAEGRGEEGYYEPPSFHGSPMRRSTTGEEQEL
mmetsp:Transcript_91523/g.137036  ORF Transcript_91523/g.137036 Transcript_91523/m.137036 type:complete len:118 (-) Transcript_91523:156-509(-)